MRRTLFRQGLVLLLMSSLPAAACAATAPTDFKGLADLAVSIITTATAVVIGLGVFYYLWGVASSILKSGQGGAKDWENFRARVLWGILTLFVMFMIWAILRVLQNTLFP